jgi:oxygen-independent coproporphyrinogen-3 oxidase
MHRRGEIMLPDDDAGAALYEATAEEAARFGLRAYEVSNYAVPGGESRHNLIYWRYGDYAGIGPGAHGRITTLGALVATRRHRAPESWAEMVERDGHGIVEELPLEPIERAREMLLMGLRLAEGIDPERFVARTGVALDAALDQRMLRQAFEEGYVEWRGGRLAATGSGRLRLDALLGAIVV